MQIGKPGRKNLGWKDALLVGAAQGISVLPGISRSGTTIAAALFRGVDSVQAVRFSFLLSVPAIVGAELYALLTRSGAHGASVAGTDLPAYFLGTLAAFVVGMLAIRIIVATAERGKLVYFALYCWILGGATIILA
jgi:undecaprenyl-diphosphatase